MTLTTNTLSKLESHLWESANILRGPVDAADFKTYIFPLFFFKRISDAFNGEYLAALEESGGDHNYALFPENHRFQIPDGCHWNNVRERTEDIGAALQYAFHEIEKANPRTLYGIFGDAQWTNKDRLSDNLLRNLIEHFSELMLSDEAIETDILGQSYEYLIKKFADQTNKKAGEFYTPRSIVRLMIEILDPQPGETIYDPACGTGGMLLEAVNHVRRVTGDVKSLWGKLFGQEKNLTTSGIARINLFMHEVEDFEIVRGDTLRNPAFFEGDRLATFDCVIANPPFSLEHWGEEIWVNDSFGRNFAGVPPTKSGDFAWVQHMIKSLAVPSGRMGIVLPHGALFRAGAEGQIRKRILELDVVEAVIGVGPNLFYGTGLAACVLILRQQKRIERQNQVLFIDASTLFKRGRNQNTLEAEHINQILELYSNYQSVDGLAKIVNLDEIEHNDWNLNIPRYVEPISEDNNLSVEEALNNLKTSLDEAYEAEEKLKTLLKQYIGFN